MSRNDSPSNLDHAVSEVVSEPLDPKVVDEAAARVWHRLSSAELHAAPAQAASEGAAQAPSREMAAGRLETCDDYQALIPAYLAGQLSPARTLLFEDHSRSCIACRRALRDARAAHAGVAERPVRAHAAGTEPRRGGRFALLAMAAALIAAVGLGGFLFWREVGFGPGGESARVESVEGSLFRVASQTMSPLGAGERVGEGEEVRTAKGSRAVLRLADGSLVEMNERAALSYDAQRSGTTLELGQGRIIVQAAKQQAGRHLYVATDDCQVSVVGTIFAVNHGTKGSRVSVVEGEVRVRQAGRDDLLHPGNQVTTRASVAKVPVGQEVAWSQNASRYEAILAELTSLGQEIDRQVARPGLRTSTHLLDLAPAGTMVWVALPNLTANLADTQRLLDERLASSDLLRQWWGETMGSGERSERFHETIAKLGELGQNLGDEVAFAMTPDGPVVLAEVTNPAAFRATLEQEAARLAEHAGKQVLRLVDGPIAGAGSGAEPEALLLWVKDDLFIATPIPALLDRMAAVLAQPAANPFRTTAFHDKVAEAYAEGAGWLFSGDFKALLNQQRGHGEAPKAGELDQAAEKLGILDLDHVVVDRREGSGGRIETRAALTFDQSRRGIAAWLAAPAPMGALDFISPDANLAAAFVVKDPVNLLDDLLAAIPDLGQKLDQLESEHGFSLRDLATPLGGEMALAVDGPLLPTPSWKLVLEVYDPAKLQTALEALATKLDAQLRQEGKPGVALAHETVGGRTYWALAPAGTELSVHWVFADGYLVMGPSRALLERTLQQRAAGATLASSAKFRALLPQDRQVNFSALVYHDLGSALSPLAGTLQNLGRDGGAATGQGGHGSQGGPAAGPLGAAIATSGPTLTCAYGEDDRIVLVSNGQASPLGLNLGTLLSLGGFAGNLGDETAGTSASGTSASETAGTSAGGGASR